MMAFERGTTLSSDRRVIWFWGIQGTALALKVPP
jgi:hypothetical protein